MLTHFIFESWRELRMACRTLRQAPIVTIVAVASLALGIGANTAIFAVLNSLVLRALPVADPARLVLLTDTAPSHVRAWSYAVWLQIHQRPDLFERSAAWSFTQFNLASSGETQLVDGMWASGAFFDTLGVGAMLGRTFSEDDDRPGGGADGPVAVISYGFWQKRLGGAADVIGRSMRIDEIPFTIVGVTPPDFSGPEVGRNFDVIAPVATEPMVRGHDSFLDDSGITFLTIIARLRRDQSLDGATAGLRRVQPRIREATMGDLGKFGNRAAADRYMSAPFVLAPGATGYAGARDLRGIYERPLLTIMAVVALLLVIACVNVASLLVARSIARRRELSLRLALGASRGRLVRQLLTESAVLYAAGAAIGLALATWISRLLVSLMSTPVNPIVLDLSIDRRILAFTVATTALVTLLFGTAPAFRTSSVTPLDALKEQGRTSTSATGGALAGGLIVLQVALSLVLVVAAGLFVHSFVSLTKRPLGFEPSRVLTVSVDARRAPGEPAQRILLYERARAAVRALPEVANAALSLTTPLGRGQFTPSMEISEVSDTRGPVWANLISPGWFDTFGTPFVTGRDIADGDRAGTPRVAVVNEAFARKFAGNASPIGRTIKLYPHTARALGPIEVVGVVGDAVYASRRSPAPPTVYIPIAQFDYLTDLGIRPINLSVRSKTASPLLLSRSVTTALTAVDPHLALTSRPLVTQVDASIVQERLLALLSASFGALALLLAGLGLYGVTADAVARRRTEIGIRMALGASAPRVIRLVLARTMLLVGIGVVVGVAMSVWAARFVGALVYGLEPRDPSTLAGAIVVLAAAGGLAAWLPLRRAVRIDPAVVLRES